jgi:hypothetical protein
MGLTSDAATSNVDRPPVRRVLSALLALGLGSPASGCWYHVEKYCAGCTVVEHDQIDVPPPAPGTHTEVVLVHGSFGFGGEWGEVVRAVRESPGFELLVWSWPGPFRNPLRDALALRAELQALLDSLPPSVGEIIVLAHSAGGLIGNLAIRQLRVPPGRHMTVALLDPAFWPRVGKRADYTPLPEGVTATVFFAKDPPAESDLPAPLNRAGGPEGTDMPWRYVGAIGHDPMVAKASLPILEGRREPASRDPASP